MRPPAAASPRRRAPPVPTDQGEQVSEIQFDLNREILRDFMNGVAEWANFADQIRNTGGYSHELTRITIDIVDDDTVADGE